MKILIVVDMQNDFITGALGTAEAQAIVPAVVEKINQYNANEEDMVIFTRDTHFENYMETLEGEKLPVPHCIVDTEGWQLAPELPVDPYDTIYDKLTFGFIDWADEFYDFGNCIEEIELCGLCTDICVISNALILRAAFPNTPITVDAKCCAGVTPEKHAAALEVMKSCQIDVINE